ncbi:MAG: UvrD/REP helicase family protein, partial [Barrevirus sp.]
MANLASHSAQNMKDKLIQVFGFLPKVCTGTIDSIAAKFYFKFFRQGYRVNVGEYAHFFLKYLQSKDNLVSNLYQYVFVDEAQDLSEVQFSIVNEFYKAGAFITFIGDASQNIYSFRGSQIKYILNLDKYFKNLSTYTLCNNYRSTPEIISLANYSIKLNKEQVSNDMIPNIPSINVLPIVLYFDIVFMQNNSIIKKLVEFNDSGIKLEEIAILCRVNYPLKLFEESIEKHNQKAIKEDQIKYVALINDDSDSKPKIKSGHITLTTIHKSKGLEWSHVIVLGCQDSLFPSQIDNLSIQEERRLFYVAVTRAKTHLYLCFCSDGPKKPVAKISRFIQELDRKLYDFPQHSDKYYTMDTFRPTKWVTGVSETLKLLNETDLAYLRESGILPITEPVITKITDRNKKHEFNKFITD